MNDDEIRIAIAELCGLSTKKEQVGGIFCYRDKKGGMMAALPNYLNDLNAMHEAEMMLNGEKDDEHSELAQYYESLCLVCGDGMEPLNVYEVDLIRSTARQRAEAFLRTKGLWKE